MQYRKITDNMRDFKNLLIATPRQAFAWRMRLLEIELLLVGFWDTEPEVHQLISLLQNKEIRCQ